MLQKTEQESDMIAGVPTYLLEEAERLQAEYGKNRLDYAHLSLLTLIAADNDVYQEVDRSARRYLKIGGDGQWLELSRLVHMRCPKGKS